MPDAGSPPPRGFPEAEFRARTEAAQALMAAAGLDALLLTTEPEVRYFSGFLSQFWQSPTRPWFLVVPAVGKPVAVIPTIGEAAMTATWLDDIRTWPSPTPEDEGVSLLARTLTELAGPSPRIGVPRGPESHLRMPLADYDRLLAKLPAATIGDAGPLIRRLRMRKSTAEIAKIRHVCGIASDAFEALPGLIGAGMAETEVFRRFKIACLERGADDVPYLVGGAGPGGYDDIISPPSSRPLAAGDVLILDTGCVFDGYYCDFDRNYAIGAPDDAACAAYETLWRATEAGFAAARPGHRAADIYRAMQSVMDRGGAQGNAVGRLGHGLGMQLTEWPSHTPRDDTVIEPGMVLTLEPGMTFAPGRAMVHEENIVIGERGPEYLSRRAPPHLPVIGA